jgi:hypothetical protein
MAETAVFRTMPTIARFSGFSIVMYFEDHNPPHVHVVARDFEALVAIRDGSMIRGSLPAKFRAVAFAWIRDNREMLLEKWNDYH